MSKSFSERRLIENQVVFREANERVHKNFEEMKKVADEDGQKDFVKPYEDDLQFYCECSDENCHRRISVDLETYGHIHAHRDRFMIVHGHDVKAVERVVQTGPAYCVVEKFKKPPKKSAKHLRPTGINDLEL